MKDLKLYMVIGFSLLAIYILTQYYRPKPVNWQVTLSKNDKIPFGTYVLYHRIQDIFPGMQVTYVRDVPYTTFTESKAKPGNYILIAQKHTIDEYDFKELQKYMLKGNNVFIAGFYFGTYFTDSLKLNVNSERKFNLDDKTPVRFVNPSLDTSKTYVFDKGIGEQYFSNFDSTKAVVLGINDKGHANFIKYSYGEGALYLIASPMFFTNYNLLKPQGAEYVAKTLSVLPIKQEIIWDEYSALGAYNEGDSPLRVIFDHYPLRWAYFIALFSLLIFVLYEIKRRQRIIPIVKPLQNSSVEFVKTVGQVYYQQRNNSNIAQKKAAYFLEEIRSKYQLKSNKLDDDFSELLETKSGVDKKLIIELISQLLYIQSLKKVSDQQLIAFNYTIEQFQHQSQL